VLGVAFWAAGGVFSLGGRAASFGALALALAALVGLGAGGILPALLFMLLGFSLQNRVLLGLGLLLFPVFLAHYYYNLHLDLLAKSVALVGSGLVMFLVRSGLNRWVFTGAKEAA